MTDKRFGAAAARLSGHAAMLLGWTPATFWAATPEEMAAILTAAAPPRETAWTGEPSTR